MEILPVFSAKTLSERWGCSQSSVYNMIKKGELKAFKVGSSLLRITSKEVLRYENASLGGDTVTGNSDLDSTAISLLKAGQSKPQRYDSESKAVSEAMKELHQINNRAR